jgi:hypothetical protein
VSGNAVELGRTLRRFGLAACVFTLLIAAHASAQGFVSAPGSPFATGSQWFPSNPGPPLLGDFNGDGALDVVVSSLSGGAPTESMSLLLGDGRGALSVAPGYPVPVPLREPRHAVEMNGDGDPDLVEAGFGGIKVWFGDGQGGFAPAPGSPFPGGNAREAVLGDFTNDGALDLMTQRFVSGSGGQESDSVVSVKPGNGQGGFASTFGPVIRPGVFTTTLAAGDFNNDGRLGAVFADRAFGGMSVMLADGFGGFEPAAGSPFGFDDSVLDAIRTGDVDNDGDLDVVTQGIGEVRVLLGDGLGGLTPAPGPPFASGAPSGSDLELADFNLDGNLDVAMPHDQFGFLSHVTVLLGDGAGGLAPATGSPYDTFGQEARWIEVGDMNGDGKPDIVSANAESDNVSVLLNELLAPGEGLTPRQFCKAERRRLGNREFKQRYGRKGAFRRCVLENRRSA